MSELYYKKSGTRRTIIIEETIEEIIKKMQNELVKKNGKRQSRTKIVNTLLVAGMMASVKFTFTDWFELKKYFENKKIEYEEESIEKFLENLSATDEK